jgi:hypothetical protein
VLQFYAIDARNPYYTDLRTRGLKVLKDSFHFDMHSSLYAVRNNLHGFVLGWKRAEKK